MKRLMSAILAATLSILLPAGCGGGNPERESIGGRGGVAGETPDQRPSGTTTAGTTGVPGSEGPGSVQSQTPMSETDVTSSTLEDATSQSSEATEQSGSSTTTTP